MILMFNLYIIYSKYIVKLQLVLSLQKVIIFHNTKFKFINISIVIN